MKFVANLDEGGALQTLHESPVEECNLDDAAKAIRISAIDAFTLVARDSLTYSGIAPLLCGHCIKGRDGRDADAQV